MDMTEYNSQTNQFAVLSQKGARSEKMYDCCPNPWIDLDFQFTLQRLYMVDRELGRIDNPHIDQPDA